MNILLDTWATAMWRACWQGGLVVLAVWILCRLLPSMPARFQCWLWRLAILKFVVVLLVPWFLNVPLLPVERMPKGTEVSIVAPSIEISHEELAPRAASPMPVETSVSTATATPTPVPSLPVLLFFAWIIGMVCGLVRLLCAWRDARRLRHASSSIHDSLLHEQLAIQANVFRVRRPELRSISGNGSPMLIGIVRPTILMPMTTLDRLSISEQKMVLGHELAHVKRGDLLWRVLAAVVRATFFFHPLMWLSHWRLGLSQEIAADELAIAQQKHDPASYGNLLVSVVGKFGPARVFPRASVETAGSMKTLKRRLVAMKYFSEASRRIVGTSLILLAMVAVLGLVPWRLVAAEQQQGRPSVQRAPVVSKTLKSTVSSIGSVALAPNGKMLASVDANLVWAVKLWDVATGRNTATLRNPDEREWILCVAFSPDGKILAMGGFNKIMLWDVKTGKNVATFGDAEVADSVTFSPDGKTLAAGSADTTIKLWDVASGKPAATLTGALVHLVLGTQSVKPTATLSGHQAKVYPVVYSPDGKTLASGSEDCTVKLWNVTSGKSTATLTGHNKGVYALAFAPNGRTLASGSDDGTIKLWDIASEKNIATLMGHTGSVWGLGFSPDSKMLISGSADKSIRMWDISTRKNIHILNGHTDWVFSAFYSPDGRTLVSGSRDGTVKLWDSGAVNK